MIHVVLRRAGDSGTSSCSASYRLRGYIREHLETGAYIRASKIQPEEKEMGLVLWWHWRKMWN